MGSRALSRFLAIKNKREIINTKKAGLVLSKVLDFFIPKIDKSICLNNKIKHSDLSHYIDDYISKPIKANLRLNESVVKHAIATNVQSGGQYDFKLGTLSNNDFLIPDTIVITMGARYSMYCALISQTFMITSAQRHENQYQALLAVMAAIARTLLDGEILSHVYKTGLQSLLKIGEKELIKTMPKSFGFLTGLELRDNKYLINSTNNNIVRAGMVFVVKLFTNKTNESKIINKNVNPVQLMHTYIVCNSNKPAELVTGIKKKIKNVLYESGINFKNQHSTVNDKKNK